MHVLRRPELGHVFEPATDLIAHGACNIVARYLVLIVNKRLSPNLSINFILSIEVVADVVFLLGNLVELLLSVDVHTSDGLTELGSALVLVEGGVSHL